MKSQDPTSWRIARDKYNDELESEEEILSFDNGQTYYRASELEELLE